MAEENIDIVIDLKADTNKVSRAFRDLIGNLDKLVNSSGGKISTEYTNRLKNAINLFNKAVRSRSEKEVKKSSKVIKQTLDSIIKDHKNANQKILQDLRSRLTKAKRMQLQAEREVQKEKEKYDQQSLKSFQQLMAKMDAIRKKAYLGKDRQPLTGKALEIKQIAEIGKLMSAYKRLQKQQTDAHNLRMKQSTERMNAAKKEGTIVEKELKDTLVTLNKMKSTKSIFNTSRIKKESDIVEKEINDVIRKQQEAKKKSGLFGKGLFRTFTDLRSVGLTVISTLRTINRVIDSIITKFTELDSGVRLSGTLIDDMTLHSIGGFKALANQAKDISYKFGVEIPTATNAMYKALTSGVEAANLEPVLDIGAKLSIGGRAEFDTVVDGITSLVNAYDELNYVQEDVTRVSDTMFTAMKYAKATLEEISNSVGQITTQASTLGISVEEITSGLAALTRTGLHTEEAATQLRALMKNLLDPAEGAKKIFDELGLTYGLNAFKAEGFIGTLTTLKKTLEENGYGLQDVLENVRGLQGAFALTGNVADDFNMIMEEMNLNAETLGLTTEAAYEKSAGAVERWQKRGTAAWNNFMASIGEGMSGAVVGWNKFLLDMFGSAEQKFNVMADEMKKLGSSSKLLTKVFGEKGELITPELINNTEKFNNIIGIIAKISPEIADNFARMAEDIRQGKKGFEDMKNLFSGYEGGFDVFKLDKLPEALKQLSKSVGEVLRDSTKDLYKETNIKGLKKVFNTIFKYAKDASGEQFRDFLEQLRNMNITADTGYMTTGAMDETNAQFILDAYQDIFGKIGEVEQETLFNIFKSLDANIIQSLSKTNDMIIAGISSFEDAGSGSGLAFINNFLDQIQAKKSLIVEDVVSYVSDSLGSLGISNQTILESTTQELETSLSKNIPDLNRLLDKLNITYSEFVDKMKASVLLEKTIAEISSASGEEKVKLAQDTLKYIKEELHLTGKVAKEYELQIKSILEIEDTKEKILEIEKELTIEGKNKEEAEKGANDYLQDRIKSLLDAKKIIIDMNKLSSGQETSFSVKNVGDIQNIKNMFGDLGFSLPELVTPEQRDRVYNYIQEQIDGFQEILNIRTGQLQTEDELEDGLSDQEEAIKEMLANISNIDFSAKISAGLDLENLKGAERDVKRTLKTYAESFKSSIEKEGGQDMDVQAFLSQVEMSGLSDAAKQFKWVDTVASKFAEISNYMEETGIDASNMSDELRGLFDGKDMEFETFDRLWQLMHETGQIGEQMISELEQEQQAAIEKIMASEKMSNSEKIRMIDDLNEHYARERLRVEKEVARDVLAQALRVGDEKKKIIDTIVDANYEEATINNTIQEIMENQKLSLNDKIALLVQIQKLAIAEYESQQAILSAQIASETESLTQLLLAAEGGTKTSTLVSGGGLRGESGEADENITSGEVIETSKKRIDAKIKELTNKHKENQAIIDATNNAIETLETQKVTKRETVSLEKGFDDGGGDTGGGFTGSSTGTWEIDWTYWTHWDKSRITLKDLYDEMRAFVRNSWANYNTQLLDLQIIINPETNEKEFISKWEADRKKLDIEMEKSRQEWEDKLIDTRQTNVEKYLKELEKIDEEIQNSIGKKAVPNPDPNAEESMINPSEVLKAARASILQEISSEFGISVEDFLNRYENAVSQTKRNDVLKDLANVMKTSTDTIYTMTDYTTTVLDESGKEIEMSIEDMLKRDEEFKENIFYAKLDKSLRDNITSILDTFKQIGEYDLDAYVSKLDQNLQRLNGVVSRDFETGTGELRQFQQSLYDIYKDIAGQDFTEGDTEFFERRQQAMELYIQQMLDYGINITEIMDNINTTFEDMSDFTGEGFNISSTLDEEGKEVETSMANLQQRLYDMYLDSTTERSGPYAEYINDIESMDYNYEKKKLDMRIEYGEEYLDREIEIAGEIYTLREVMDEEYLANKKQREIQYQQEVIQASGDFQKQYRDLMIEYFESLPQLTEAQQDIYSQFSAEKREEELYEKKSPALQLAEQVMQGIEYNLKQTFGTLEGYLSTIQSLNQDEFDKLSTAMRNEKRSWEDIMSDSDLAKIINTLDEGTQRALKHLKEGGDLFSEEFISSFGDLFNKAVETGDALKSLEFDEFTAMYGGAEKIYYDSESLRQMYEEGTISEQEWLEAIKDRLRAMFGEEFVANLENQKELSDGLYKQWKEILDLDFGAFGDLDIDPLRDMFDIMQEIARLQYEQTLNEEEIVKLRSFEIKQLKEKRDYMAEQLRLATGEEFIGKVDPDELLKEREGLYQRLIAIKNQLTEGVDKEGQPLDKKTIQNLNEEANAIKEQIAATEDSIEKVRDYEQAKLDLLEATRALRDGILEEIDAQNKLGELALRNFQGNLAIISSIGSLFGAGKKVQVTKQLSTDKGMQKYKEKQRKILDEQLEAGEITQDQYDAQIDALDHIAKTTREQVLTAMQEYEESVKNVFGQLQGIAGIINDLIVRGEGIDWDAFGNVMFDTIATALGAIPGLGVWVQGALKLAKTIIGVVQKAMVDTSASQSLKEQVEANELIFQQLQHQNDLLDLQKKLHMGIYNTIETQIDAQRELVESYQEGFDITSGQDALTNTEAAQENIAEAQQALKDLQDVNWGGPLNLGWGSADDEWFEKYREILEQAGLSWDKFKQGKYDKEEVQDALQWYIESQQQIIDASDEYADAFNALLEMMKDEINTRWDLQEQLYTIYGDQDMVLASQLSKIHELLELDKQLYEVDGTRLLTQEERLDLLLQEADLIQENLDNLDAQFSKEQQIVIKRAQVMGYSEDFINNLRLQALDDLIAAKEQEIDLYGSDEKYAGMMLDLEEELLDLQLQKLKLQESMNDELSRTNALYDEELRSYLRLVIEARKLNDETMEYENLVKSAQRLLELGVTPDEIYRLLGIDVDALGLTGETTEPTGDLGELPDVQDLLDDQQLNFDALQEVLSHVEDAILDNSPDALEEILTNIETLLEDVLIPLMTNIYTEDPVVNDPDEENTEEDTEEDTEELPTDIDIDTDIDKPIIPPGDRSLKALSSGIQPGALPESEIIKPNDIGTLVSSNELLIESLRSLQNKLDTLQGSQVLNNIGIQVSDKKTTKVTTESDTIRQDIQTNKLLRG
jgi:TP901 family phage tail tape measure protein